MARVARVLKIVVQVLYVRPQFTVNVNPLRALKNMAARWKTVSVIM